MADRWYLNMRLVTLRKKKKYFDIWQCDGDSNDDTNDWSAIYL